MSYISKTVDDSATLSLLLTKSANPVTGLSPTAEVRRASDDLYLDWAAIVAPYWVSSGGQREKAMPEKAWQGGYYSVEFDQSVYDPGVVEEYFVIYRNASPYKVLETETIAFSVPFDPGLAANMHRIIQHLENDQDLRKIAAGHFFHKVYDDNGAQGGTGVTIHEADIAQVTDTEERRKQ